MEDLPFDFDVEKDPDDDDNETKEKTATVKPKNRNIGKELVELIAPKAEEPKKSPEAEKMALDSDKTPELDTEAPVEHLSKVEIEAISQTLATERITEIQAADEAEFSTEDAAAENFLENVEISGDIEQAFAQTANELGVVPDEPLIDETSPETTTITVSQTSSGQQGAREPQAETVFDRHEPPRPTLNKPKVEKRPVAAEQPVENGRLAMGSTVRYLLKRREARINSEKKIPSLTNRLEKEVVVIRQQLIGRESQLRRLVEAKPKVESLRSAIPKQPSEQIGKVLVEAQLPSTERLKSSKLPEITPLKAQNMNRNELLGIAQKIRIEGTTLRQIYESHLLGEKGLRRVIAVFLRGGNVKRSLRRELVEREIDFERDPALRDQGSDTPIQASSSSIDSLLEQSGIDWAEPSIATINKQPSALRSDILNKSAAKTKSINPLGALVDVLLIGIILLLIVLIAVLLIKI